MKPTTVFVTYNPKNEFEQTLAVRLHTIGAVHGFNMLMPDRFNGSNTINLETTHRIKNSDYFILFSTSQLTPIVLQEINVALTHLKDKSKVLIIYDRVKNLKGMQNCTEVYIDSSKESADDTLRKVMNELKGDKKLPAKKEESTGSILGGILLVGLGLLALNALSDSKK
jgi:hypothetical protein